MQVRDTYGADDTQLIQLVGQGEQVATLEVKTGPVALGQVVKQV